MKKAKVIIGGAFGDEGKGLFTDYLSSRTNGKGCAVRFNGGAQAGHTVELANGVRHVFSHFGSGSLAGLPSFLSSFFVCSPITFLKEYEELRRLQCKPSLFVDPACPVTTPYDMVINQVVEKARGNKRHGSVGVGFGETLERQTFPTYALCVRDLLNTDKLRAILDLIRGEWVTRRLAVLDAPALTQEWQDRLASEGMRERFIEDCGAFLEKITIAPLSQLRHYNELIFEGAQGLLLDQNYGWFPHVTRSNTGIRNVIALSEKIGISELDIYYLTRSYVTRHGAGPLPHELQSQPYAKIVDKTNRPHAFQGNLRFARFDIDLFRDTVGRDLTSRPTAIKLTPHLGMSCLDQIDDRAGYIAGGIYGSCSPEALLDKTRRAIGATAALASYGPTRQTIQEVSGIVTRSVVAAGADRLFQTFDVAQGDAIAAV